MPDPIRKRFGYGQLWLLWTACSQNRVGSYVSDPTSRIRFGSVLLKRHGSQCAYPARIRRGWPGQVLAKRGWSGNKPVCKNHRTRFWLDATGPVPVPHFKTQLPASTDGTDHIVQNRPGSGLVLADCARFWPNGSGPEASRCARIIRPASGQRFLADPDRFRIGSGMFTGLLSCPLK